MVRSTDSGVNEATKVSTCTPLQRDEAPCHMTCGLDRISLETDKPLYVTSPDKLFVPSTVIEFLSLTLVMLMILVTSTPTKPPGRGSDAPVGGGRARIASNHSTPFQWHG